MKHLRRAVEVEVVELAATLILVEGQLPVVVLRLLQRLTGGATPLHVPQCRSRLHSEAPCLKRHAGARLRVAPQGVQTRTAALT